MKSLFAALALVAFAIPALAAEPEAGLESAPGYVDFADLAAEYGEPRVMVNIGGPLLRIASAMQHDDPVAAEALSRLKSVRVHVYDTQGNTGPAAERLRSVGKTLAADNWDNIVRVREDDELVDVYLKQSGERIQGVTVMAIDEEETVFVNILGDIDPAQLSTVVDSVDLDFDLSLADFR